MIDAPELEGLPCIEIYERELTERAGLLPLRRPARARRSRSSTSSPARSRTAQAKIAKIIDDVDDGLADLQ